MKFKTIFIIFNIIIVCSFIFIFFMPLILLGGEHFSDFLVKNWFIGLLFVATLVLFNIYFIRNWEMFQYIEKEDWPALIGYLEKRIYQEKILHRNHIRLLINSYLVTSNTEAISKLESHIVEKKSNLIGKFAIQFGVPYLLQNKPHESEKYFGKLLAERGLNGRDWIRWNYAFSLMQLKQMDGARDNFIGVLNTTKDPILSLLSLYMLNSFSNIDLLEKTRIDKKINDFKNRYTPLTWKRKVDRSKGNIETLILSKIIKDAGDWIFNYKPQGESDTIN